METTSAWTRFLFRVFFLFSLPFEALGWWRVWNRHPVLFIADICSRLNGAPAVGVHRMADRSFLYPLFDPYWCRLAFRTFEYEPEIGRLLRAVGPDEIDLFLDGGANVGMWSSVAAGLARDVVAVEASTSMRPFLRRNSRRGPVPFDVEEKALWSESGLVVRFSCHDGRHASACLADVAKHDTEHGGWRTEDVETISVDDLIARRGHRHGHGVLLVKLDVEGAERAVMQGASRALTSDRTLLVYEDHGKDETHEATGHLFSDAHLRVHHLGPGGLTVVTTFEDLRRIKTSRGVGYNFFCCRRGGAAERLLREAGADPLARARAG